MGAAGGVGVVGVAGGATRACRGLASLPAPLAVYSLPRSSGARARAAWASAPGRVSWRSSSSREGVDEGTTAPRSMSIGAPVFFTIAERTASGTRPDAPGSEPRTDTQTECTFGSWSNHGSSLRRRTTTSSVFDPGGGGRCRLLHRLGDGRRRRQRAAEGGRDGAAALRGLGGEVDQLFEGDANGREGGRRPRGGERGGVGDRSRAPQHVRGVGRRDRACSGRVSGVSEERRGAVRRPPAVGPRRVPSYRAPETRRGQTRAPPARGARSRPPPPPPPPPPRPPPS